MTVTNAHFRASFGHGLRQLQLAVEEVCCLRGIERRRGLEHSQLSGATPSQLSSSHQTTRKGTGLDRIFVVHILHHSLGTLRRFCMFPFSSTYLLTCDRTHQRPTQLSCPGC